MLVTVTIHQFGDKEIFHVRMRNNVTEQGFPTSPQLSLAPTVSEWRDNTAKSAWQP
jgi:hypothetical protein